MIRDLSKRNARSRCSSVPQMPLPRRVWRG